MILLPLVLYSGVGFVISRKRSNEIFVSLELTILEEKKKNILHIFNTLKFHQEDYVQAVTRGDKHFAIFVQTGREKGKTASIIDVEVSVNYVIIDKLVKELPSRY